MTSTTQSQQNIIQLKYPNSPIENSLQSQEMNNKQSNQTSTNPSAPIKP